MGFIISITNQKGGVAKTTTALHLAIGLSENHKKTLFIDLDPQRNATGILLKQTDFPIDSTVYTAFQKKIITGDMVHTTTYDNLFVIPSSIQIVELENSLSGAIDGFFRLSESMRDIAKEFQYIILDCPPSLSVITVNALVAATHIIIPLQVSKFSIDGINGLLDVISTIQKRYNAKLKIMGGLFTFYDERTTMAKMMNDMILKKISIFKAKIPRSVSVEEAHMVKRSLYDYAPKNKVTQAYSKMVMEVIHGLE
ncbi:MAG: ParA family protein [Spirochaetia bacterium]|nr:ParA family protein [Spirochaetia bacterium]